MPSCLLQQGRTKSPHPAAAAGGAHLLLLLLLQHKETPCGTD